MLGTNTANRLTLRRDVRSAISVAYELMRSNLVQDLLWIAQPLSDLEQDLLRLEAKLGSPFGQRVDVQTLDRDIERLHAIVWDAGPIVGAQIEALVGSARKIVQGLRAVAPSLELPSRPLFGALPLARVVPQDVHSVLDYAAAGAMGASALLARSPEARAAGGLLCAATLGVSALTDHRLGLAKVVPVEAHEAFDYVVGAACIAAPFVLGYRRSDPLAAIAHVAVGALTIGASLVTDYRAAVGKGRGRAPLPIDPEGA